MQPTSDRDRPKISHVVIYSKGLAVNIMLLSFLNVNVCKANLIHIALIVVNVNLGEFRCVYFLLNVSNILCATIIRLSRRLS